MRAPTHSQVLRTKLSLCIGTLAEANQRLFMHSEQDRIVPSLLILCYQVMRAAVPLMDAALSRARELAAVDSTCPLLAAYFEQHIEEERDHDAWLLEDLERAGLSRAELLARLSSPWTAALAGAQYYWIRHEHPVSLLGYLLVLEGRPLPSSLIDTMEARSGLPSVAFRTLREHARIDQRHMRELDLLLDDLPLTRAQTSLLGLSVAHTVASFARCIEELLLAPR